MEEVWVSFITFTKQRKPYIQGRFKHVSRYMREAGTARWWELFYKPKMLSVIFLDLGLVC